MASLYQSGESIEGLHTDGASQKVTYGRPQMLCDREFSRCVLDRNARLEITRILPDDECLHEGSYREAGDLVAGDKVRVLTDGLLECDTENPRRGSARHRTRPVWTRCHTIASVVVRYTTVPERLAALPM